VKYRTFLARIPDTTLRKKVRAWVDRWVAKPATLLGETFKSAKTEATGDADVVRVLNLAPADESHAVNLCPWASEACRVECLRTSGHNVLPQAKVSRIGKTAVFMCFRTKFLARLRQDLRSLQRRAEGGLTVAVRLNNLSDVVWEKVVPGLFEEYPGIQFFDYTKSIDRTMSYLAGELAPNYHLTFSVDERDQTEEYADMVLSDDGVAAVVFAGDTLPETWNGYPVVDGDLSDATWAQAPGTVRGLRAKGAAKESTSGFARTV